MREYMAKRRQQKEVNVMKNHKQPKFQWVIRNRMKITLQFKESLIKDIYTKETFKSSI